MAQMAQAPMPSQQGAMMAAPVMPMMGAPYMQPPPMILLPAPNAGVRGASGQTTHQPAPAPMYFLLQRQPQYPGHYATYPPPAPMMQMGASGIPGRQ
jgi:hypothetical protein